MRQLILEIMVYIYTAIYIYILLTRIGTLHSETCEETPVFLVEVMHI